LGRHRRHEGPDYRVALGLRGPHGFRPQSHRRQLRALARNGGGGIPGFNKVTEAPNVTIELVRRGYTEDQVRKIWGGNLLRVWRAVAKAAASN
jgi:microsomal dipeptidase-like Zn-dependent dipeptidase